MTHTNAAALAQLGEKMRARQQQNNLSAKQISWLTDGYNLGYLTAEEAKVRFGALIDELEGQRNGQT